MSFQKDFDQLLNDILTDYTNQFPGVDISQGSLIFIRSACLASALWGLYQQQDYIARQIFPDSSDTANLEHHAWLRGVTRVVGETDAELLTRLLEVIRRAPAGGNKYDYIRWAKSIDNVAGAWCYPLAQGDGTVDVVITADLAATGSEIPSAPLLAQVLAYINDVRPVTHSQVRVLAPTIDVTAVTMDATGDNISLTEIASEVTALLNSLAPNQTLYKAQLVAIAIQLGAVNVTVSVPAADVVPATNHMIRPGVISVT